MRGFYGITNIVNLSGCFSNIRYRVYRIYGSIGILSKINNIVSLGHSFNNRAAASSKGNSKRYNVCCKANPSPRIIRVFDDVNNAEAKRHNIEYCIPKLTTVVYTHYRVIIAVRIEILVGVCHRSIHQGVGTVSTNESSDCRIVISVSTVIESRFAVLIIPSITEGIGIKQILVDVLIMYHPCATYTVTPSIIIMPHSLRICFVEKSNTVVGIEDTINERCPLNVEGISRV